MLDDAALVEDQHRVRARLVVPPGEQLTATDNGRHHEAPADRAQCSGGGRGRQWPAAERSGHSTPASGFSPGSLPSLCMSLILVILKTTQGDGVHMPRTMTMTVRVG